MSEGRLRLASLALEGFRNLKPLLLEPGPHFNVLFGDNGAGKSSLLEAIGYLSSLRSFRAARKEDLIALDARRAQLSARVESAPLPHDYRIALDRSAGRTVTVDGKRPRSLGSYYGLMPQVLFHPGDTELMSGAPEARRAFLDRVLEQIDPGYARLLDDYGKALRSRNRLLKAPRVDARSVRAYDPILADLGEKIGRARLSLSAALKPLAEAHFAEITDKALPIELSYAPRHEPDREVLLRALGEHYEKDVARGSTGVGPHGDDLRASLAERGRERSGAERGRERSGAERGRERNGAERGREQDGGVLAKHHASQGQHRALVLALKVAELSVLAQHTRKLPLLLLDDVSSELDRSKNRRFFQLLGRIGSQVFLTTTQRELILLEHERVDFHVDGGTITRAT